MNRYLTKPSGGSLVPRTVPALITFGLVLGAPAVFGTIFAIAAVLDIMALGLISFGLGFVSFIAGGGMAWYFIMGGMNRLNQASHALRAGDLGTAVRLAQWPLSRAFRADVRMRAFYTLGLAAESNGDFAEAAECFRAALDMIPTFGTQRWKRQGQLLMHCHSAIAFVATNRIAEADSAVRLASQLFLPGPGGFSLSFMDDSAFGNMGVSAALRDLELGRDPRALLSLASALVLVKKGMPREALDLVERERYFLNSGLQPREHVLVAHIEQHARGQYAGGPMRAPAQAMMPVDHTGWASRILP